MKGHSGVLNHADLGRLEIQQKGKTVTVTCCDFKIRDEFTIGADTDLVVFVNSFVEQTCMNLTTMEKIQIRNWIKKFTSDSINLTKKFNMSEKVELLEKFSKAHLFPDERELIDDLGIDLETYLLSNQREYMPPEYEEDDEDFTAASDDWENLSE
jgi:hypothetical protein